MDLHTIMEEARNKGYQIESGSNNSTIKTRQGEVKVNLDGGFGQPHCWIGKNEINLFQKSNDLVGDLVHEREHFQIYPYDLISFGLLYGGAMGYSILKVGQQSNWFNATLVGLAELIWAIKGGLNLYQDAIIYARHRLNLDRKRTL
jgi:hypothetical protein